MQIARNLRFKNKENKPLKSRFPTSLFTLHDKNYVPIKWHFLQPTTR